MKLVSPLYSPVIVCVPTDNADVLQVACSADKLTFEQIDVVPSLKVTLPVGLPVVTALTVAVKVIVAPTVAGLVEEASVVRVFPRSTLTTMPGKVSVPK